MSKKSEIIPGTPRVQVAPFSVSTLEGYQEKNNSFIDATRQHNEHINKLNLMIRAIQNRIEQLRKAQEEGVFKTPAEFDLWRYGSDIHKFYETIEKRRQALCISYDDTGNRIQAEAHITSILENWTYYFVCLEYCKKPLAVRILGDEYKGPVDIAKPLREKIAQAEGADLFRICKELGQLASGINYVIMTAHTLHNNNMRNRDITQYNCPAQCGNNDCYAYANSAHTTVCQVNVYWNTDHVDLLRDISLDDKLPVGRLVCHA